MSRPWLPSSFNIFVQVDTCNYINTSIIFWCFKVRARCQKQPFRSYPNMLHLTWQVILSTALAGSPSVPPTWTGIMLSVSQWKSDVCSWEADCSWRRTGGDGPLSVGQGGDKQCLSRFLWGKLRSCEHDLNKVTQSDAEQERRAANR